MINPHSEQDWTTVVITKSNKAKTAGLSQAQIVAQEKKSGNVSTQKKVGGGENKSVHQGTTAAHLAKLENSNDEFKHSTVNRNLSQAIQQARLARQMTQKQLATAINEKPQVIQQYESGQAIPNPQVINKMERVLGIHLPRK